jgi:hypothetical protein
MPRVYRFCERLTEATLYFMVVFGPWAFGTTQPATIWLMNGAGFLLGALLAAKYLVRWTTGYRPASWRRTDPRRPSPGSQWLAPAMAILTVSFLGYVLAGALNARAAFNLRQLAFDYFTCIPWLPHSYDRGATWFAFWQYLGLACVFWAARDWLPGAPPPEQPASRMRAGSGVRRPARHGFGSPDAQDDWVSVRVRRLLMVVCISGTLAALEGIAQRLAGSDKLLFLLPAHFHPAGVDHFGPYANRNNGAEYFNLVWPVCAGLAWLAAQSAKRARAEGLRRCGNAHVWLTIGALFMGVCPLMSGSRGGALVSLAMVTVVLVVMLAIPRRLPARSKIGLGLLVAAALQGAVVLGWDNLRARLEEVFIDDLSGRLALYKDAAAMARDYPALGLGAGAFESLYYFYRTDETREWAAYLHDDWFEFRITLGWIGFGLLLALLAGALLNWFIGRGPPLPMLLAALLWIAMAGCLFHARFDFPFRVHSIAALFILYCAILSSGNRRAPALGTVALN